MGIGNLPIFQAIKSKMEWNQSRQKLLAENVANADTPGYRGRDLVKFDFESALKGQAGGSIATVTTNARHIAARNTSGAGGSKFSVQSYEITPNGNGVTLEDEMMKVAANQMDYQAATSLYSRSIKLLRTALGR
ncbi:Flagellar basal-body rod protein FlgB [hydrothermal vent metagenome]|uniref:Flagellar basal-body rod protein FlgB n=1 Tax=hydrothermal vent metagenome TaxID=652676 RepID=A0A3B0UV63_9ZZZZ